MLGDAFDYTGAECFATVLAPGVNDPGEVRSHTKVMKAAYDAGYAAVSRGGPHG
jgi:hypothetical protein